MQVALIRSSARPSSRGSRAMAISLSAQPQSRQPRYDGRPECGISRKSCKKFETISDLDHRLEDISVDLVGKTWSRCRCFHLTCGPTHLGRAREIQGDATKARFMGNFPRRDLQDDGRMVPQHCRCNVVGGRDRLSNEMLGNWNPAGPAFASISVSIALSSLLCRIRGKLHFDQS
ncbi:hypothetical protein EV130_101351 [Rhizobium azibense]|uniref:Uncharacterized protein n=1 Tax=Rhizobium azibense TaxID=1136135 RepID=A0A4R3S9J2_9HYPH|nr:hypothetical protein EV130_101351 [Rhizobium azibense]TCU41206.1 hypothetical protein EV129_101493 [Rhizobium azibense]